MKRPVAQPSGDSRQVRSLARRPAIVSEFSGSKAGVGCENASALAGRRAFWTRHPGLVWSNRLASDAIHIRAALLKPRFAVLLEIAVTFGIERLENEWAILQSDPDTNTKRVEKMTAQILANLRRGYEQARA